MRFPTLTSLALLALLVRAASSDSLLDGGPDRAPVNVVPGTTVPLTAHLNNLTANTIYLRGLSYSASETFTGTVSLSGFLANAPDSLLPGDSWHGVIATIDVPAGPGTNTGHRLDFFVTGGVTRFDGEVVSELTFAVDDSTPTTGAGDAALPRTLQLSAAPNPGRASTRIRLALPAPGRVDLRIFDVGGRARRVIVSRVMEAGEASFTWDGRDDGGLMVPAGTYFLRAQTPSGTRRVKLVRVR